MAYMVSTTVMAAVMEVVMPGGVTGYLGPG
jgi:hypothetical protein